MGKGQYTAQQFIKAIPGSGGIVATIAKRVGCEWSTANRYIKDYPTIQQAYQDECETVSDMAESTLIKSMQEGDVSSAKWWLARKRRITFGDNVDITSKGEAILKGYIGVSPDDWDD